MTLSFDVYWSFRSPYCYLASHRLLKLTQDYDVTCRLRPIYPIALRVEGYFKTRDPLHRAYFFRDHARIADYLGVPLQWPVPDPVVMSFETGEVAKDQPYIHRLTKLAVGAGYHNKGLEFACALSGLIFGGTKDWDQGDHIARTAASVGLDLAELETDIQCDHAAYDAEIEANQAAQRDAGHWGVPLMVFDSEPFWGQDRIDILIWRMTQKGLQPR